MPYEIDGPLTTVQPIRATPPSIALLMYGEGQALLKHAVQKVGEGYVLGAGVNLTQPDVQTLVDTLGGRAMIHTQANTLATGVGQVAWWVPPGGRALRFDAKYAQTKTISALSGTPVPCPGLVMVAGAGQLSVFAVTGSERPGPKTVLCHAPFWNMFASGRMCQGSVTYPQEATPSTQAAWEACFFDSVFTGASRTDRYMNWGKSYQELLEHAQRLDYFPDEVLISTKKTLTQTLAGEL